MTLTILVVLSCVAVGLAVYRIVSGPTHSDRVVALDILLAAGVALCIAAALYTGRTVFLDVGIGLSLVAFVATMGWARLIERAPRESRADTATDSRSRT